MATAKIADRNGHHAAGKQQRERKRPALNVQASFDDMMRRYPNTMARLAE
jgi:hypothetical protein